MSINIFQQIESSHIAEEDVAVEVSLSTSLWKSQSNMNNELLCLAQLHVANLVPLTFKFQTFLQNFGHCCMRHNWLSGSMPGWTLWTAKASLTNWYNWASVAGCLTGFSPFKMLPIWSNNLPDL
jgi:hypothetical protein